MSTLLSAGFNAAAPGPIGSTTPSTVAATVFSGGLTAMVGSAVNTTSNTAQDITGLSFTHGTDGVYVFYARVIATGGSGGQGVKLTMNTTGGIGTGSVRMMNTGNSSSTSNFLADTVTALGTLSTTYVAGSSVTGFIEITGAVTMIGGSAGTMKFQYASSSNGTSVSLAVNSSGWAIRLS